MGEMHRKRLAEKVFLNNEEKELIYRMIFGEYEKEWFVNGVVDNKDSTIAKRMNLSIGVVSTYTSKIVANHFRKVDEKRKAKNL